MAFVDLGRKSLLHALQVEFPTMPIDAAIDRFHTGKGSVAGNQRVLILHVEFTPSLALYIWQSFRKVPYAWGAVQCVNVANLWGIAAMVCSTQGCIATSMANSSQFLPDLLKLDPVQTFSVDRLLGIRRKYVHAQRLFLAK